MACYEKHPALPQTDSEGKQTDIAGAQRTPLTGKF